MKRPGKAVRRAVFHGLVRFLLSLSPEAWGRSILSLLPCPRDRTGKVEFHLGGEIKVGAVPESPGGKTGHQVVQLFRGNGHDDLVFPGERALLLTRVGDGDGILLFQEACHQRVDAGVDRVHPHLEHLPAAVFHGGEQGAQLEIVVAVDQQHVRLKLRAVRRGHQQAFVFPERESRERGEESLRFFGIRNAHQRLDDLIALRSGGAVGVTERHGWRPAPFRALVRIDGQTLTLHQRESLAKGEMAVCVPGPDRVFGHVGGIFDEFHRLNVQLQLQSFLQPRRGFVRAVHCRTSVIIMIAAVVLPGLRENDSVSGREKTLSGPA